MESAPYARPNTQNHITLARNCVAELEPDVRVVRRYFDEAYARMLNAPLNIVNEHTDTWISIHSVWLKPSVSDCRVEYVCVPFVVPFATIEWLNNKASRHFYDR